MRITQSQNLNGVILQARLIVQALRTVPASVWDDEARANLIRISLTHDLPPDLSEPLHTALCLMLRTTPQELAALKRLPPDLLQAAIRHIIASATAREHERMLAQVHQAGGTISKTDWMRANVGLLDVKGFEAGVAALTASGRIRVTVTPGKTTYRAVALGREASISQGGAEGHGDGSGQP
jgi:hypothetical protein